MAYSTPKEDTYTCLSEGNLGGEDFHDTKWAAAHTCIGRIGLILATIAGRCGKLRKTGLVCQQERQSGAETTWRRS